MVPPKGIAKKSRLLHIDNNLLSCKAMKKRKINAPIVATIWRVKFAKLFVVCSADLTAFQTVNLTGMNRNTVNRIYHGLRECTFLACEGPGPMFGCGSG